MDLATPFGWVGRGTVRAGLYLLDLTVFVAGAVRAGIGSFEFGNQATRRALITQVIFTGVDALPVITLLALAIGVSITAQILSLGEALGSTNDVTRLLISVVGMELGSLLTAILLIGRSGSAIAVDLGNMKLHHEVEGLELLGVDIVRFFVAPRVLGAAVAQVVLAGYFYVIALFGGILLSGLLFSRHYFTYLQTLAIHFDAGLTAMYALKNLLFGLIVAGTACFHALRVGVSPTEVPQQTQRAIVNGIVLVFVIDGLFALARGVMW
ncbi:MAG: ABC transporter permease [Gammaproteobacteria bacterium]|nr:ABC transporter permease [Gammaproteobacteria bacterium]